jgi:DNA-binding MarR family transcriptional regulator
MGESVELGRALLRLSRLVQAIYTEVGGHHGLTPTQAQLLSALAERPQRMTELATVLGLSGPSLTRLVDRVERRGLVDRCADPGDGRVVWAALTDTGRKAASDVNAEFSARLSELGSALPGAEREQFGRCLLRLVEAGSGERLGGGRHAEPTVRGGGDQ